MRFTVTQRFPTSRDEVLGMYTGTDMWSQLSGFTKVSAPEVVDHSRAGSLVTLRLASEGWRISSGFIAGLPAAATALIDPRKLVWVEETVTDLGNGTATVSFRPEHYANKLSATARVDYGEARGSATRRVVGDLKVNVFLVGSQVERAISSGLSEHLAEEERAVRSLPAA